MLIKYSGKYVKMYFNMKVTFLLTFYQLHHLTCQKMIIPTEKRLERRNMFYKYILKCLSGR